MDIVDQIKSLVLQSLKDLYATNLAISELGENDLTINITNPEFEGDYTLVLFSFVKLLKKSPDQLGKEIGDKLVSGNSDLFSGYNIIKGFLNIIISDRYWTGFLKKNFSSGNYGVSAPNGKKVMVEYSSPNTNKPLHLGHLRNIFLGWSVAETLKTCGYEVIKSCIVNDRGIHICKSMIAWQLFANGATPESTGTKGDHFVGKYYVQFNEELKRQAEELVANGIPREQAEKEAPIMKATQTMLQDWEAGKPDVIELWKKMNGWVYKGFDVTYKRIGADFDIIYYESDTYLLGKKSVEEGLSKNVFVRKDDGSVWADLTPDGLDEKLVLRKDGTSVYMTQDLGLAQQKYEKYHYDDSIYVIGDEQNYHMKALKLILKKMNKPYAAGVYHLSYGMVELPQGKMKSREGTVVDADDLIDEMVSIASKHTLESGKVKDFTGEELGKLYETIGLGALKFFLLRVDPKKRMVFNPEESVDFHGFTGPFVQYTHARIKSILRKAEQGNTGQGNVPEDTGEQLLEMERNIIILLEQYPSVIRQACLEHNPSVLAIYTFNLAKSFNTFYSAHPVVNAESDQKKILRLRICEMTAGVIASGMRLLGINVPERM